ncbi:MAG TPA: AcvB/VirJ family lysyl-phosphatidylglycerol hydrolase [Ohtaekwangia sp.]|uniref:AcvB/VirJ family lysyl-phosphatidylglycerol hydrolase n=1 Tax=Ohtaekwangia sp. TaxID=2066019 RepID=UPI002F928AD2
MHIVKTFLALAFLCSPAMAIHAEGIQTDTITFGRFGKVYIYRQVQTSGPQELVLFVSGDAGWRYGVMDMAKTLAGKGAVVAGIDILRYWKNVLNTTETCVYPSADFENLSQYLQEKYKFSHYEKPVLCGYSSGATLIYGLMAQAPLETYKGGIALGFCPDIISSKPLCEGSGLHHITMPNGKGYDLLPRKDLTAPFAVLIGELDHICDVEHTAAFMKSIPGEKIYRLPKVGHGFAKPKDWQPQFLQAYSDIVKHADQEEAAVKRPGNLPVTEIPCIAHGNEPVIIAISGDGGWKGFINNLGGDFAAHGVPVAGVDALRYFWTARTPEQSAKDIEALMRYYMQHWHRDSCILLGYSFGADVMPFVVNRLPEDLRSKLRMVVLLSPDDYADFEFHFASWFDHTSSQEHPVMPEIEKMTAETLVIYGKDEAKKPATALHSKTLSVALVNGDHHYHNEHAPIREQVLKKLSSPPDAPTH